MQHWPWHVNGSMRWMRSRTRSTMHSWPMLPSFCAIAFGRITTSSCNYHQTVKKERCSFRFDKKSRHPMIQTYAYNISIESNKEKSKNQFQIDSTRNNDRPINWSQKWFLMVVLDSIYSTVIFIGKSQNVIKCSYWIRKRSRWDNLTQNVISEIENLNQPPNLRILFTLFTGGISTQKVNLQLCVLVWMSVESSVFELCCVQGSRLVRNCTKASAWIFCTK